MTSKMKTLGIALAAVFAVSAVAASVASAEETEGLTPGHFFSHAANGKTHVSGGPIGENNVFTITDEGTEGGKVLATFTCPNEDVSFTGTGEGNTVSSVTGHPTYSPEGVKNCQVKIGGINFGKLSIDTGGCNSVLSANTDANGHAPVHFECEEGKETTITAPLGCTVRVGEQTPDGGVHYENVGTTESEEEAIMGYATVREIHYTSEHCPGIPSEGNFADLDGQGIVRGYEDQSEEEGPTTGPQVSIAWTETEE